MKKFLLALAVGMCSLASSAKSLVLTLNDGAKVYFIMTTTDIPVMRVKDGTITVNGEGSYTFSQIKSFVISETDDPNAIEDVAGDSGVGFRANTLLLSCDIAKVKVYNASGALVEANISSVGGGRVSVDLNGLNNGVYLISTGNTSFKIMKK